MKKKKKAIPVTNISGKIRNILRECDLNLSFLKFPLSAISGKSYSQFIHIPEYLSRFICPSCNVC